MLFRAPLVLTALATGALVTLLPRDGRADQFILFDASFTYTWEDAVNSSPSKSHYYVNDDNHMNLDRPSDFTSPVNYRDGTIHIRMEVMDRPEGGQETGWALCYIPNEGGYGCPYTSYESTTGVFERDVDMHEFYNNETIGWESGIDRVDCVYTKDGSGSGHVSNFPELETLVAPITLRLTVIHVSEGATYDPIAAGFGGPGGSGGSGGAAGSGGSAGGGTGGASGGSTGGAGVGGMIVEMPTSGTGGSMAGGAGVPSVGGGGSGGAGGGPGVAPRAASPTSSGSCAIGRGSGSLFGGALFGLGLIGLARRRRSARR